MVRDILTKEHCRRETHSLEVLERLDRSMNQAQAVFCRSFSRLPNLGREDCWKCKTRLQPFRNAHLVKTVLDIGGTNKTVLSVSRRSLKFDKAKTLPCEQRLIDSKKCGLLARASMMNLEHQPCNEKETNVFHRRFIKPN